MDFFKYILRRILNKIPLKLLLFICVILISLFLFNTFVNADSDNTDDLSNLYNIINGLDDRVFAVTNANISNFTNFYFYDEFRNCYHIVSFQDNKTSFYSLTENGQTGVNGKYNIDIWTGGYGNIYLYSIDFDTYNVSINSAEVHGDNNFNTLFDMDNTFNIFNFLYVKINSQYVSGGDITKLSTWNTSYTNKITPIEPYILFEGNSFIIDDKIIIKPADTEYINNTYLDFSIELWNSDAIDLSDGVAFLSIPFNTNHSYWNSIDKQFEIPYSDYLDIWLTNDENYTILINLFTNNHFYNKIELISFDYINNEIIPDTPINPDNPDEPTTPNYTQDINNINNSINNSNVDDMTSNFSGLGGGFRVSDPTGLDNVFQKLYNAFCTDNITNLSFNLPFVNKPVTISSSNISTYFPSDLKNLVTVFVWGSIGLFVLKDIRSIVDKISEGSPEDVGSDVKKEVL